MSYRSVQDMQKELEANGYTYYDGNCESVALRHKWNIGALWFGDTNTAYHYLETAREIASLQEAAASHLAVNESQSEKLGEARNFIEELAMANPGYERIADWIDRAKKLAKQWQAAELQKQAAPKSLDYLHAEAEPIMAMPYDVTPILTRHNEVMATFYMGSYEIVAFPRTWLAYGRAVKQAHENSEIITIQAKLDMSKGKPQYIMSNVEGVEPHVPEYEDKAAQAQSAEGE